MRVDIEGVLSQAHAIYRTLVGILDVGEIVGFAPADSRCLNQPKPRCKPEALVGDQAPATTLVFIDFTLFLAVKSCCIRPLQLGLTDFEWTPNRACTCTHTAGRPLSGSPHTGVFRRQSNCTPSQVTARKHPFDL